MTAPSAAPLPLAPEADVPRVLDRARSPADRFYRRVSLAAGLSTLVILALIALFLLLNGLPAFRSAGWSFFTTYEWATEATPRRFGVGALLFGTAVIALLALALAVPVSIGTALFINEVAPARLRRPLTSLVDMLAAVPSLIYGIWGLAFLQPQLYGVARWLASWLGWFPLFSADQEVFAGSMFVCGVVVAMMVVPIITAVVREVFAQAPRVEREGALALGATRWGMLRTVVLPFGKGGVIGGSMLGLGRALGETIAVALIISPRLVVTPKILDPGGSSVASHIALEFPEANRFGVQALMAAGVTLFLLTLVVNLGANVVVARSRSGAGVEL